MGESSSPAGAFFGWSPCGIGRRWIPCARCGEQAPAQLLENLLELLCPGCGRNVALERFRQLEADVGADGLGDRLCELGVLQRETLAEAIAAGSSLIDTLLDRGLLRRDLRLTLDVSGEEGWHRYGAKPLKEVVLPAEVEAALDRRRAQGGALTDLLRELVLQRLGATLRSVGEEVGLECLTDGAAIDPALRTAIPPRALEIFRGVPLRRDGDALVVALWNPLDFQGVRDLEALLGGPVYAVLAQPDALATALRGLGVDEVSQEGEVDVTSGMDVAEELSSDPLFGILLEALEEGASEVLVEPHSGRSNLRFRVRGELRDPRPLPIEVGAQLADQLRGLSVARGRPSAEDGARIRSGSVRYEVSGLPLNMDYRVVETAGGPSVALGLEEGDDAGAAGLGQLGLSLDGLAAFEEILARRQGVVVVASSRRDSAYHAILQRAVRLGGVVTSVEARTGRLVPGSTQLDMPPSAADLQKLLNPLPDWLGVDGSLEPEVLRLAVDVALRGSGVVLTVPAPDAESALLRLELAGIPRRLLEVYVKVVLARRLVSRLCAHCRVSRGEAGWIGLGCAACADQGAGESIPLAELACPTSGGLVTPLAGTRLLTERAHELVRAGDVQLEAVSDLLRGERFAGGAA